MFNKKKDIRIAQLETQIEVLIAQLTYSRKSEEAARAALEQEREFWRTEFQRFSDRIDAKVSLQDAAADLISDAETPEQQKAREAAEALMTAQMNEAREWILGPQIFIDGDPMDKPIELTGV